MSTLPLMGVGKERRAEKWSMLIPEKAAPVTGTTLCMYVCMVIIYSEGKDQPGKVANPARGQLNREDESRLAIDLARRVRQSRPASD